MEDFDFDRSFADKLRQTSAPDFSKEDWHSLSAQLSAHKENKHRRVLATAVVALLLLLLGSNFFWWNRLGQMNQRLMLLEAPIKSNHTHSQDTIWATRVVHQYDTIYQTRILYATHQNPGFIAPISMVDNSAATNATSGSSSGSLFVPANNNKLYSENPVTAKEDKQPALISLKNIPPGRIYARNQPRLREFEFVPVKKRTKEHQQLSLSPRSFMVGAGGGFLMPGGSFLDERGGFSTTLNAEIGFSDQLSLVLETNYMGVYFKGSSQAESLDLPFVAPPSGNFTLKYYQMEEGGLPMWQMATGMQYMMRPARMLRPFVGLNYAAYWRLPYEMQYEFVHIQSGQEQELSAEVESTSGAVSMVGLSAGIRYQLAKRLYVKSGINYLHKADNAQRGFPSLWGINALFQYQF